MSGTSPTPHGVGRGSSTATRTAPGAGASAGAAAPRTLAVLGAGAWGTALARVLARNGHQVRLWSRDPEHAAALEQARENQRHLPGARLPDSVRVSVALEPTVAGADGVVLAIPVRATRSLLARLPRPELVVSCGKGFVDPALTRLTGLIRERFPGVPVATLSGPNLAAEIGADRPAAATAASDDAEVARRVQRWFGQASFRVYTSGDPIGVETSGAVKNVIALAAGMADGLGLGDNAKAALITRGLAELVRLGTHLGGHGRTFYGLAGLGDLVATCASAGSRNRQAGERLVHGATLADLEASGLTAEGLRTVAHVESYARSHDLDLPLTREVHAVVHLGKAPHDALGALMHRQATGE